jgi:hypothetical protein
MSDVNLIATATDEHNGTYLVTDLSGTISTGQGDFSVSLIPNTDMIASVDTVIFRYQNLSFSADNLTYTLSSSPDGLTDFLSYFFQVQNSWDAEPKYINIASAVPEPSTWVMIILGFCGLGFMMDRRKDKLALSAA